MSLSLVQAAQSGNLQAIEASMENFDPESDEAKQALRILIEKIHLEGTSLLLSRGMERTMHKGQYLLHNAVLVGNRSLVSLFLQSREVEATDEARAAEDERMHNLLHLEDDEGLFPLAIAVKNDNQDMVDYLLVSKAQASYKNANGEKAANFAIFDEMMNHLIAQEELQKNPAQGTEASSLGSEDVASKSHSHGCHIL